MTDVFVSYSRRDADFVTRLVGAIEGRGLTAWLDRQGIPPSAEWMREILGAIEGADCFVYVATPEAAASEVCALEVRHALENHKRIVPVLWRPLERGALPPELERLQWVDFRDDAGHTAALEQLVTAVRTDPERLHLHTRLLTRAVQWRDGRGERSLLLRGTELEAAERWLARASSSPEPTDLQREFLRASRVAADRRRRFGFALAATVATVLAVLGGIYLRERGVSAERKQVALAVQTASQALAQLERSYDVALLLAVAAHQIHPTVETAAALQRALLYRPHLLRILRGATARAVALRFDPGARRLVAGLGDSSVVAWDLDSGRFAPVLPPAAEGYVDAFALDGALTRTASGGGHQRDITVRALPSGDRLAQIAAGDWRAIQALAFSPVDPHLLASANGNGGAGASVWDVESRAERYGPLVSDGGVAALAFSLDGRLLATAGWFPGVALWDVASGATAGRIALGGASASALAFDAAGRVVAAGERALVLVDPAVPGSPVRTLDVTVGRVRSVAASPDGRWLAAGLEAGRTAVWDQRQKAPEPILLDGLETYVDSLAFSADGNLLASGDYRGGVALWDVGSVARFGRVLGVDGEAIRAVAVSPDGERVAAGGWGRTVRLWPAGETNEARPADERRAADEAGAASATLSGHTADIYALAFTPDGSALVSADSRVLPSARGLVHAIRWDVSAQPPRAVSPLADPLPASGLSGLALELPMLRDDAFPIALDGGGVHLARVEVLQDPGAPNGVRPIVEVREVATGRATLLNTGHSHDVAAVALSPAGDLVVTAGADGRIELWDVAQGVQKAVVPGNQTGACGAAAFDHEARRLAVGCAAEVRLYDVRGASERGRLVGHAAPVTAVAFDSSGRRLASADEAGRWALWDLETGSMIGQPVASGARIHQLVFTPDGRGLVSGDAGGRVIVWDVDVESWRARACRAANRELGEEEWRRLLPAAPAGGEG